MICEGYVRDEGRDENVRTPLFKGILEGSCEGWATARRELSLSQITVSQFFILPLPLARLFSSVNKFKYMYINIYFKGLNKTNPCAEKL